MNLTYMLVRSGEDEGPRFKDKQEAYKEAKSGDEILTHDEHGNLRFLKIV